MFMVELTSKFFFYLSLRSLHPVASLLSVGMNLEISIYMSKVNVMI